MMSKSQCQESEDSSSQFNSEPLKQKHCDLICEEVSLESSDSQSFSEAESVHQYKRDGYHPVYIGEYYCNNKYKVVQKLGWGTFSTVWLVQNTVNKLYKAMKISKSKRIILDTALDEIRILKQIDQNKNSLEWTEIKNKQNGGFNDQNNYCIKIIDHFPHFGQNGTHHCSIFDILGPTLLNIIKFYDQKNIHMDISVVKQISRQILQGLVYIHEVCQIIHTDLKPENIMFTLTQFEQKKTVEYLQLLNKTPLSQKFLNKICKQNNIQGKKKKIQEKQQLSFSSFFEQTKYTNENKQLYKWKNCIQIDLQKDFSIKLADFGNACWIDQHFTDNIQTKEYRAPETIIGARYDQKCDIWSFGCLVFEMLTNNYLFNPQENKELSEDEDHLAMIIETLGPFDPFFASTGKHSKKFFNNKWELKNLKEPLDLSPINEILTSEYQFDLKNALEIENFLQQLLQINPSQRISAKDALDHQWLLS